MRELTLNEIDQISGASTGENLLAIGGGIVAVAAGTGAVVGAVTVGAAIVGVVGIGLGIGAIYYGFSNLTSWYGS